MAEGRRSAWCRRAVAGLLVLTALAMGMVLAARPAIAQVTGSIRGTVQNGTAGGAPPAGVEVVVHVLTNRAKTGEHRVQTDPSGAFQVEGLAVGAETIYLPIVEYGGVPYYPESPITLADATPVQTAITVFESTPRPDAVSFDRLNMLVIGVTPTALTIMEMGAVTNAGDRTYAADPQATGSARTLRFPLPPGAIQVSPQAGFNPDALESMPDGFASTEPVRPGRREIAFSYQLPYTSSALDFTRSFALPVGTFTLYAPDEVGEVVGPGMAFQGTAELGGRQYRQYAVQQVSPGTEVRFRLSGLPAPLFARPRDLGLVVVGAAAIILLGFLGYGIWRRRADAGAGGLGSELDEVGSPVGGGVGSDVSRAGRPDTGGLGSDVGRVGAQGVGGLGSELDGVRTWKPAPTGDPGVGAGFQQPVAASPNPNLPRSPHQPRAASPNQPPSLPPLRAGEAVGMKGPHGRGAPESSGLRGRMAGWGGEVNPSPAERLALVRAVAQLDERFEAGELDEEAYRAERAAQKARLVALTRTPTGAL